MALMSYLIRDKHGTYYFRRIISPSLRPFMPPPWAGKREWKRSLRTKDPAAAKRAASHLLRDCMADFELAERAKRGEAVAQRPIVAASPDDIERDVLSALLAGDEGVRRGEADGRKHHQTPEERAQWPDLEPIKFASRSMERDQLAAYRGELEMLSEEFREALSRSDASLVEPELRVYLRQKGLALDPSSEDYDAAGLAVLRAHVRAYGLMLDRQDGAIVPTPEPSAGRGPKVSEAFAAWKAGSGARGGRKPSANTVLEADHAVRRFTEFHGDVRLGAVTRDHAREFRDALTRVPTRLPAALKRLPLRDLLNRDLAAYPTVHASTVNKSLTLLATIFVFAEKAGRLDAVPGYRNPFGPGLKLDVDARASGGRQGFDAQDLAAICGTGVYQRGERPVGGGGEAAFWLPLLALLSGARQGELAQLRLADLAEDRETGVLHLDIGTEGGRTIKTASSRRKVPVHPELVRIGLVRYRDALIGAGAGPGAPLWPHLEADAVGRRGGAWSKWFNRHLRAKAGIKDRSKVFHSFRHSFKSLARAARLGEDVHDALTGHTGGGIGRRYGGFGLDVLAAEVERIKAPGALAGLRWEPARVGTGGSSRSRGPGGPIPRVRDPAG